MIALIDWILSLFRSEDAARAFVSAPEQALRDAGLAGVSAAQLSAVAATAVPGLVLGGGDPIVGLQRAVANQYGFPEAAYAPEGTYAPQAAFVPEAIFAPAPTFAPQTTTDLASHNDTSWDTSLDTSLFSPPQQAGANAQQGAFNLGFGDITLGNKTSQSATDGGVVVGADATGDIVSGEGAVLGNANSVTNGDIRAEHGSNVSTGEGAVIRDSGTTTTAGGDAGVHLGDATLVSGSQTTTSVGGTGNTAASDGHQATATTTTTTTTTEVTDNSDSSSHSLFDAGHDTSLVNSDLDSSHDLALASGNHLLGF